MIISKTPLRVSFTGGGSDLPAFYQYTNGRTNGAVISTTIDKYIFVNVNRKFDNGLRVAYSINEEVSHLAELKHPIVKAVMEYLNIDGGLEITTIADIPSKGTGLGSSSAFCVGLLHALFAFTGQYATRAQLAELACMIEMDKLREPIGKQDQYASAFGGLNYMEFYADGQVLVEPITLQPELKNEMEQHCLFLYTGITRSASGVLAQQQKDMANDDTKFDTMSQMVSLTKTLKSQLNQGKLHEFGEILHQNWLLKRSISTGISTPAIDEYYELARKNGAIGGKLLGAGAGGFLMFYAPPDTHHNIIQALSPCKHTPFRFTQPASQIIFYDLPR